MKSIATPSSVQRVSTRSAVKDVIATETEQCVISGVALVNVVATCRGDGTDVVVAAAAPDVIIARAGPDHVVSDTSEHAIVATTRPDESIVAASSVEVAPCRPRPYTPFENVANVAADDDVTTDDWRGLSEKRFRKGLTSSIPLRVWTPLPTATPVARLTNTLVLADRYRVSTSNPPLIVSCPMDSPIKSSPDPPTSSSSPG